MSNARNLANLLGTGTQITTADIADGAFQANKNLIINGAMQVWQRGTGLTGSGYRIDRWYTEPRSGTIVTHDQSVDVPSGLGFSTSAHVYRSGGNDNGFHLNTNIELDATGNYSKFATGTKLVYSVYIKKAASAVQTNYNPYIYLNAGTGGSNSSQAVFSNEGAGTMTNDWQRMVFTFTCPTWTASAGSLNNVNCLVIRGIMGQDNTNQDIYITGAQLEVGDTATPFEHRSYADELRRCQRYYETIKVMNGYFSTGQAFTTAQIAGATLNFKVTKRTNPTLTAPAAGTAAGTWGFVGSNGSYATIGSHTLTSSVDFVRIEGTGYSGISAGNASMIYSNGDTEAKADAEL